MINRITTDAIRSGRAPAKSTAKFTPRIRPITASIKAANNARAKSYSLQHLVVQISPLFSELFIGQYITSPPFM